MQSSQVIGLSDEKKWSQTFAEGNLIVALELSSDGSFSAIEEGDKFLKGLIELLKKRQPQDKIAFKLLVNQYINSSLIQSKVISLIVGMTVETSIYLFCKTSGKALIKRGNLWSEIISGDGFVTGSLQEKDVLIFVTQTFQKLVSQEVVMEKFSLEDNLERAGEKLGSLLHNFDDSKGAAGVFTLFNKGELVPDKVFEKNIESYDAALPNLSPQTTVSVETKKEEKIESKNGEFAPKIQTEVLPIEKKTNLLSEKIAALKEKLIPSFTKKKSYPNETLLEVVSTPKKRVLVVALVLTGVLVVSILFGLGSSSGNSKSTESSSLLESITHKVEEGEALIDLNNLRAKTVLAEAQTSLLEIKDKYKKGSKERIQTEQLLQRAENALSSVSKSYKIENPSIFLDLTVTKAGALAKNFAIYENKLAVLDTQNTSVILVNTDNLASSIVGGGSKTPQPKLIGIHGNSIFVFTSSGLVKIDTNSKNQEVIVKNLSDIGEAADLIGYAGNVYILDSLNKKIWKFMALEKVYSEARPYLAPNETVGFEKVVSMAIDGSVWILGDNRVKKYSKGTESFVTLEGLDKPLINPEVIFTDDESKYFYILDKGNNRVVVFDKEGVYNSEYVWSGISGVSDMVVLEKAKKILLLVGSTIYSIDLRI